jgi:uncharacterized protein
MLSTFKIGVSHSQEGERSFYTVGMLERVFGIHYIPYLRCHDWRIEKWIQKKSAYFVKHSLISELPLWLGALHKKDITHSKAEHLTIRWIGPEIGYGVITEKNLSAWSFVGEYAGVLRTRGLFKREINDYCFMYPYLGIPWYPLTIDSEKWGNFTRFINHSDTPNLESYSFFFEGQFRIGFRTLREVQAGEELRYDYGDIYWLHRTKQLVSSL